MQIDVTNVFDRNYEAINLKTELGNRANRYIINTGSSRSSKTYSLIDCIDWYARANTNKRITVWRETKKDCKDTVMSDFIKRLTLSGRFTPRNFNKTESVYSYSNGTRVEFRGTDEESVFGLTQDVAWLNEPYSISKDVFDQIDQRTSDFVLIDWNPKQNHYIDDLSQHPRAITIHSTFRDNPFCPPEQRLKILSYDPDNPENVKNKTANKFKWEVYGLGIKGEVEGRIYQFEIIDEIPHDAKLYGHGFDYGYAQDPSSVTSMYRWPRMDVGLRKAIILDQRVYKTGLRPSMLFTEMVKAGIKPNDLIIGDRTAQLMMDELFDLGFGNIHPAKGNNEIQYGISKMQDYIIYITKSSTDGIYEMENYKNKKDKKGKYLSIPEEGQVDHFCDSSRYIGVDYAIQNNFFVI